jgi:hypothetical protein
MGGCHDQELESNGHRIGLAFVFSARLSNKTTGERIDDNEI